MPQVEIHLRKAGAAERTLRLDGARITLGRALENDIVLSDLNVSRRHAALVWDGAAWWVEDAGSNNGVFLVGGKRVQRHALAEDEEVVIEPFSLRVRALSGPSEDEFTSSSSRTEVFLPLPASDIAIARLVQLAPIAGAGRSVDLPRQGVLWLGRGRETALDLSDPMISRQHVVVEGDAGTWLLRDNNSHNGTTLNGARLVKPRYLQRGDRIKLGAVELEFVVDSPGGIVADAEQDPPSVARLETIRVKR